MIGDGKNELDLSDHDLIPCAVRPKIQGFADRVIRIAEEHLQTLGEAIWDERGNCAFRPPTVFDRVIEAKHIHAVVRMDVGDHQCIERIEVNHVLQRREGSRPGIDPNRGSLMLQ